MRCLLMCYFDEELWAKIPKSRREAIMQEYGEFEKAITRSGHYSGGAQLQPLPPGDGAGVLRRGRRRGVLGLRPHLDR